MNNFLSKIQKGVNDAIQKQNNTSSSGGARGGRIGRGRGSTIGGGRSLGGSKPGKLIHVVLSDPGPLGIKVEKTSNGRGNAIVAEVVPNTQAERAGLQRGDIICHPNSNGEEEIMYEQFLAMASSERRPLTLDVRRIQSSVPDHHRPGNNTDNSADAYARRRAVIAAAEARDRSHKAKTRPVSKSKSTSSASRTTDIDSRQQLRQQTEPMTDDAKKMVEAAKLEEIRHASKLGYNPYETAKMTAGQAKTANNVMAHGAIQADGSQVNTDSRPSGSSGPLVPTSQRRGGAGNVGNAVGRGIDKVEEEEEFDNDGPIHDEFDNALAILVTSHQDDGEKEQLSRSLTIMQKLIVNATTKGQQGDDDEASAKFRKVRMLNPKIKAAITDVPGALDLMMSVGFVICENSEDSETYLVFPPGTKGPSWLPMALKRMERAKSQ